MIFTTVSATMPHSMAMNDRLVTMVRVWVI